jgi:hypothetical protein
VRAQKEYVCVQAYDTSVFPPRPEALLVTQRGSPWQF